MVIVLYGIFMYRQWQRLLVVLTGFSLPLLGWALYIIPHFAEFELQFLSQIVRKAGMLESATGQSDTGGLLVVFFSQFGSSRKSGTGLWSRRHRSASAKTCSSPLWRCSSDFLTGSGRFGGLVCCVRRAFSLDFCGRSGSPSESLVPSNPTFCGGSLCPE